MSIPDLVNRFRDHPPATQERADQHTTIRQACLALAMTIDDMLPDGREKSTAITNLEQVMFWANAGLARIITVQPIGGNFDDPHR